MARLIVLAPLALLLFVSVRTAEAGVTVVVDGVSDPYLAGMPDGSTNGTDVAPDESPVLVEGITFGLGGYLTFTNAVGGTLEGPGCSLVAPYAGCDPIDGTVFWTHAGADENGLSTTRMPINALLGVFLGPDQPNATAPPVGLNFQTSGLDFTSLSPLLKQVFFIGDGQTSGSVVQQFVIPEGATRLYLGVMDGFGWFNNSGAITVGVSHLPEPGLTVQLVVGVLGLALLRR